MDAEGVVTITGDGRELSAAPAASGTAAGSANQAVRLELGDDRLILSLGGGAPLAAAYRDVTTLAVQQGQLLIGLGSGTRFILERLGDRLGLAVAQLRDRRARQLLADRLVDLPPGNALELAEYRAGDEHGVAQLAFHAWGAALLPLDERRSQRLIRRAEVASAAAVSHQGMLSVTTAEGTAFELLGLGAAVERQRTRWAGLREAALADAAAIVAALLPDASFDLRRMAAGLLVDGRPVERAELGEGWSAVESAVLSEPVFAASYRALGELSGARRWIAVAPQRPTPAGEPTPPEVPHMAWFFVELPASLVAMEIVSEGAHATYLFRGDAAAVVKQVSDALIDGRFLRAPIYLADEQLADARNLRYRLAIAALPSLRAARARFAGRVIHRDEEAWQRNLEASIAWSKGAPADAGRWPGGAADDDDEEGEDAQADAAQYTTASSQPTETP